MSKSYCIRTEGDIMLLSPARYPFNQSHVIATIVVNHIPLNDRYLFDVVIVHLGSSRGRRNAVMRKAYLG